MGETTDCYKDNAAWFKKSCSVVLKIMQHRSIVQPRPDDCRMQH